MFTANVRNRFAAFLLLEDADDLALSVLALFHMLSLFENSAFYF
jgi:hypothetical protein